MGVRMIRINPGDSFKESELKKAISEGAIITSDVNDGETRVVTISEAVNFTD